MILRRFFFSSFFGNILSLDKCGLRVLITVFFSCVRNFVIFGIVFGGGSWRWVMLSDIVVL